MFTCTLLNYIRKKLIFPSVQQPRNRLMLYFTHLLNHLLALIQSPVQNFLRVKSAFDVVVNG